VQYFDHSESNPGQSPRIFLEVRPGSFVLPVLAMVDTAAPWCIFKPEIGEFVRRTFDRVSGNVSLSTRLGTFGGSLYRGPLFLQAFGSEALAVEATVFVSPEWRGPSFLGYEGLLQRIRFAVDPEANQFYFGGV
jgi:hypothetical protein